MKKIFFIFAILLFSFLFVNNAYATSGCCSSHKGVDCNKIQSDGKVICNDGWTGSSCSYSKMVMCQGYNPTTPGNTQKTQNYILGCMDRNAKNYNSKATKESGNCIYFTYGCKDVTAKNYDAKAEKDNNNCEYYIYGCMDKSALNYNNEAEKDDGSCVKAVYGCMDETAKNYNIDSNVSDNSCKYNEEKLIEKELIEKELEKKADDVTSEINNNLSKKSDNTDTGIVDIGVLGTIGYFIFKKIKKIK